MLRVSGLVWVSRQTLVRRHSGRFATTEDDRCRTQADVADMEAELTRLGKQHFFYSYDDTGHGFMSQASRRLYREHAAKDALKSPART